MFQATIKTSEICDLQILCPFHSFSIKHIMKCLKSKHIKYSNRALAYLYGIIDVKIRQQTAIDSVNMFYIKHFTCR